MTKIRSVEEILLRISEKEPMAVGQILKRKPEVKRKSNVSREYQSYGCRIAEKLGVKNPSSLIKAARDLPRGIVEQALSFTLDYPAARSPQKIFFWKVNQILKGV